MAGGNIEAIRDWANNYYPKSDDIADAFVKLSLGLDAYKLTIIGDSGSQTFTLVEDVQNDPQTYEVQTIDGEYTGLFFFHTGSTIQIYDDGTMCNEHVLSDHVDTVYLRPLVLATETMTSNTTPNNIGTCSESAASYNSHAWHCFDGNVSSEWVYWDGPIANQWVRYKFNNPTAIKKVEIYVPTYLLCTNDGKPLRDFKFQGSDDGTSWTDLWNDSFIRSIITRDVSGHNYYDLTALSPISKNLSNGHAYTYYRVLVLSSFHKSQVSISEIKMYKLQDPTP